MRKLNLAKQKYHFTLGLILTITGVTYGQVVLQRLNKGLVYHQSFDGSVTPTINLNTVTFNYDETNSGFFDKSFLSYEKDQSVSIGCDSKSFMSFREINKPENIRTHSFWMNISSSLEICSQQTSSENLNILFFNHDSLRLATSLDKKKWNVYLFESSDSVRTPIAELTPDTWYLTVFTYNSKTSLYTLEFFERIKNGATFKLKNLPITNWNKVQKIVNGRMKADSLVNRPNTTVNFYSASNATININDLRIYNRSLDKIDFERMMSYTINDQENIFKYELAYTLKKIGDEFFLHENVDSASFYYGKAASWCDPNGRRAIDSVQLVEVNPLYDVYLRLLRKDIAYRQALIIQGYSFWGKEYSTIPLFPKPEYENVLAMYQYLENVYGKISSALKDESQLKKEQIIETVKSLSQIYENEILKVKDEEALYNLNFYDDQIAMIKTRLENIELQQRKIDNEVQQYNSELAENEKRISSALSQIVTQSVTGISADINKPLSGNFKDVGLAILNANPEIRNSLLDIHKDVYNLTSVSLDYYDKAKEGIRSVNALLSGDITPDKILSFGNALSGTNILPPDAQVKWNELKVSYASIQNEMSKLEQWKKDAKTILQQSSMLTNLKLTNLKLSNFSEFVDWMVKSENFPEFKEYAGLYTGVYEDIRQKKYQSLLSFGHKIMDSVYNNPIIENKLKQQIKRLQFEYDSIMPIISVFEKLRVIPEVGDALGKVLFSKTMKDYFKDHQIERFMLENINTFLVSSGDIKVKRYLLAQLSNEAPDLFLKFISPDARERLKILYNIQTDNQLTSRISQSKISILQDSTSLSIRVNGDLWFTLEADKIKIGETHFAFYYNTYDIKSFDHLSFLTNLLKDDFVRKNFLTAIPVQEWNKLFEKKNIVERGRRIVYQKVLENLKAQDNSLVISQIKLDGLKVFVGSKMLVTYTTNNPDLKAQLPSFVESDLYTRHSTSGVANDELNTQLATSALDLAFPGAGVLTGASIKIISNILDSYNIIDQLKDAYNEKRALHGEFILKLEQLNKTSHDKQIAHFEKNIASLNLELAKRQKEEFLKMEFDFTANEQLAVRGKIAAQLPLFYYYSEKLRYYLNRLDKASTFWHGEGNNFSSLIKNDPENLRFALDRSINLFEWINQPDVTSTREDIDHIMNFWQKQFALITNPETKDKLLNGNTRFIVRPYTVYNENLLATAWPEFENWKKSIGTLSAKTFEFTIDIPSNMSLYTTGHQTAAKVVEVNVEFLDQNRSPINSLKNIFEIVHPGLSISEEGKMEVLQSRTIGASDGTSIQIDPQGKVILATDYVRHLQERWNGVNYRPRNFEGYNLNSKWKLRIFPELEARDIKNIYLLFAFQSTTKIAQRNNDELLFAYEVTITSKSGHTQVIRIDSTEERAEILKFNLEKSIEAKAILAGTVFKIKNQNDTYNVLEIN